jgi:polysaccharide biosynthesis transport protein
MTQPDHSAILPQTSAMSIEPTEVLRVIIRRKWWILASIVLVGGTVAAWTMRQPKVYLASAQIVIDPVLPKVLSPDAEVNDLSEQSRSEKAFYNTQYQIIQSRPVLREASARLKLTEDTAFLSEHGIGAPPGEERERAVVRELKRNVAVVSELSRIVKIVFEDYNAERAAKIANAIADAYINHCLESRMATNRLASKWLDERAEEFKSKLESAEQNLQGFRERHMLVSLSFEDRQNMISTNLTKLTEKLVETQTEIIDLEARRRVLLEQREKTGSVAADPRIAKNPIITELKRSLSELARQKADLSTRYGERHPNMLAIDKQIDDVQEKVAAETEIILQSVDNEIASLRASEQSLKAAMEEAKQRALDLNSLGLEHNKLTRDFGTTKKMYEALLKRQTEASLAGLLESNFAHWHQTAEVVPVAVRPSVPRNTAIGAVLGCLLGLVFAVAGILLDNTVHTQADVEELLRLPFLGVLPIIQQENNEKPGKKPEGGPEQQGRDLYIVEHPKSPVAECARSIRTNLLFMGTDRVQKRILLTSAGPTEGKSTTAVVLGTTMAQAGQRVLLIDTDLRKPRLHKTFGVSGERGLTSVLLEAAQLEEAIKATQVVGLDLLPCGPLPPNPAEILHTEKFRRLVDLLGTRYDLLVFDSPPIHAVTDAVILSQIVDGTLLVVKASKTAKDSVRRATRQLLDVNAKILGVVLNQLNLDDRGYGYSYYHYYRYGYSYGSEPTKNAET